MAAGAKKFGAFSGVFTPSILTILGVIMYLRLGWIAGVAGVTGLIAIILLAHVISFSTGLSISSIATDKKIKAGGIYYILSRSLGLPMGGSIGITLFVGTALSISLYIIGFTESFLSIPEIHGWLASMGLPADSLNTTRVVGTIVLIILVVIAFISTEIAIKTQFLILGAIALSLISVVVGFFIHPEMAPVAHNVDFSPFKDFSFEVVFAIFFPAVTGFTAGVAMSGDLKDPKKDIPKGTMWAIITGLVVYLFLGLSFVLFIDKDILLHDYNFLFRLAWIPALVIAGIWGATLSSALGGILGGPRIMQAIANDHILPKFFGKGYGVNNEPRNALIFTFLLSELGILIGDLDIIAGIVTMFYLTAYGFINLAFALEKWASSDFRPSFKVPIWVGIVGFVASFMIMFKLDMGSMFAAFLILGAIYYFINQKHFHRPMTSVWQSVNTSLVRKILHKLDREEPDERNWRPNILLFSGGTKNRPHLIEFGKALVANQGMISNFDLILNPTSKVLFPKHKQILSDADTETNQGIFSRKQECSNIYEGIETIASVYGFSGVEPNTILLGWIRNSDDPHRFVSMLNRLVDLDLNLVMLDFDKERKFGNYSLIDVWWRGGSNNGNFVLSLIKFITSTYEWRNARVRIMIVNPINERKSWIERDAHNVLKNMRIDAEIRVINNEIEKRSIYDIIKQESINSDLTFLGIPDIKNGKEEKFIEDTNKLCNDIGSTVLVKASSLFKELHIGFTPELPNLGINDNKKLSIAQVPALAKPVASNSAKEMGNYYGIIISMVNKLFKQHLDPIFAINNQLLDDIENIWNSFYDRVHQKIKSQEDDLRLFFTNRNLHLAFVTKKIRKEYFDNNYINIKNEVEKLTASLSQVQEKFQSLLPDEFILKLTDSEIIELKGSGKLTPGESALLDRQNEFIIPFNKIKQNVLLPDLASSWLEMCKELDFFGFKFDIKLSKLNDLIEDYQLGKYDSKVEPKQLIKLLKEKEVSFTNLLYDIRKSSKNSSEIIKNTLLAGITRSFNKSIALIDTPEGWKKYPWKKSSKVMKIAESQLIMFPEIWNANRQIISNTRMVSWQLLIFKLRLRWLLLRDIALINNDFLLFIEEFISKTEKSVHQVKMSIKNSTSVKTIEIGSLPDYKTKFLDVIECNKTIILKLLKGLPEKVVLFNDDKFQNYKANQMDLDENTTIQLSKLISYIINKDIFQSLEAFLMEAADQLSKHFEDIDKLRNQVNSIVGSTKSSEKKVSEIDTTSAQLSNIAEKVQHHREQMELRINERLNTTWDTLRLSTLSIQYDMIDMYRREDSNAKRKNILKRKINQGKELYHKLFGNS